MIRKATYLMLAAAALLASCSKDNDFLSGSADATVGDLQEYTFTIGIDRSMEGEGGTRAVSATEDESPTRCFMQVFDATGTGGEVYTQEGNGEDGYSFTVKLAAGSTYTFCFWADNGTQEITDLTEVPYTSGTIAFAASTTGTPETVSSNGITLAHAVTKVTLKTTSSIPANTTLSVSIPQTYTGYNVQTGAMTGDSQEYKHETTVDATVTGTTDGAEVLSFYTLVTEGAQTVTIDNGTSSKEVSASLAPNRHIILSGSAGIDGLEIGSDGTYIVSTVEALQAWAAVAASDLKTNCTLAADITMPEVNEGESNWTPISGGNNYYSGTFDGAGHTISNLTISTDNSTCLGFFGNLSGTVKNLHIREANYSSTTGFTGGIAGYANGTISGCSFSGTIYANMDVGGIVGHLDGDSRVTACYSSGSVKGSDTFGRIVGTNNGTLTACYSTATVTCEEGAYYGVIAGWNSGTLSACYWSYNGGGVEQDVGTNDNPESTTTAQVTNGNWSAAMEAMNTELSGKGYEYVKNEGSDSSSFPLLITIQ